MLEGAITERAVDTNRGPSRRLSVPNATSKRTLGQLSD